MPRKFKNGFREGEPPACAGRRSCGAAGSRNPEHGGRRAAPRRRGRVARAWRFAQRGHTPAARRHCWRAVSALGGASAGRRERGLGFGAHARCRRPPAPLLRLTRPRRARRLRGEEQEAPVDGVSGSAPAEHPRRASACAHAAGWTHTRPLLCVTRSRRLICARLAPPHAQPADELRALSSLPGLAALACRHRHAAWRRSIAALSPRWRSRHAAALGRRTRGCAEGVQSHRRVARRGSLRQPSPARVFASVPAGASSASSVVRAPPLLFSERCCPNTACEPSPAKGT